MRAEYRLEPCRSALNAVRGMPFKWSLNLYMGCAHRCTFCYVRHFEQRADRPADDRYGRSIRVKVNVAEVLREELARPTWQRERVDRRGDDLYQPAEGRLADPRVRLVEPAGAWTLFSIITRGPLVVRDRDAPGGLGAAEVGVYFSLPTLDERVWRTTEPGTAPRSRLEAVRRLAEAGIDVGVGMAPILPGLSDRPEQPWRSCAARAAGARRPGRACSTFGPARGSTSSRRFPVTGRRKCRLRAKPRLAPTFRRASSPIRETVREATRGAPLRHAWPRRSGGRRPILPAAARPSASGEEPRAAPQNRPRGRRDHRLHRGRPRGRARGPSARALALAEDPRHRRGRRRRLRGRADRAAAARCRDHGPAHARHGRGSRRRRRCSSASSALRSSSSPRTASARPPARARIRGAATSSRKPRTRRCCARSRRSRSRRDVRRPRAHGRVRRRTRPDGDFAAARAARSSSSPTACRTSTSRRSSSSARRP